MKEWMEWQTGNQESVFGQAQVLELLPRNYQGKVINICGVQ